MSKGFDKMVEQQVAKARAEGQLDDLPGSGKPLPKHPEEAYIDAGTAAGHRIMAQAGVVPEEIQLKRELAAAQTALEGTTGEARKTAMAKVADLQMRLAIAQDARRKFFKS